METTAIFSAEDMLRLFAKCGGEIEHRPSLRRLLEAAYQASLYYEEGRRTGLNLVLRPPSGHVGADVFPFLEPVDLSPDALRKLAPSADPNHAALVVALTSSQSLKILGFLAETGAPNIIDKDHYQLRITRPGVVDLGRGALILRFSRDRYVVPAAEPEYLLPLGEIPGAFARILSGNGNDQMPQVRAHGLGTVSVSRYKRFFDVLQKEAVLASRRVLCRYLYALADQLAEAGTGGAILLLHDKTAQEDQVRRLGSGTALAADPSAYRTKWNDEIWNAIEWSLHGRLAYHKKWILDDERPLKSYQGWFDAEQGRIGTAMRSVVLAAQRTARLARCDGAVVLDQWLAPVAFGVKLRVAGVDALRPEEGAHVGMRHQSMAAAVALAGRSAGIVASQDGDVTFFLRDLSGVRRYDPNKSVNAATAVPVGSALAQVQLLDWYVAGVWRAVSTRHQRRRKK